MIHKRDINFDEQNKLFSLNRYEKQKRKVDSQCRKKKGFWFFCFFLHDMVYETMKREVITWIAFQYASTPISTLYTNSLEFLVNINVIPRMICIAVDKKVHFDAAIIFFFILYIFYFYFYHPFDSWCNKITWYRRVFTHR